MTVEQDVFLGDGRVDTSVSIRDLGDQHGYSCRIGVGDWYVVLFFDNKEIALDAIQDLLNAGDVALREQFGEDSDQELARDMILEQQEREDFAQDGYFENMEASEIL